MSKYLIVLFLMCGSCATTQPKSGDFLPLAEYYADTRHNHNLQIWTKNNEKGVRGITAFKNQVNCPEECKW